MPERDVSAFDPLTLSLDGTRLIEASAGTGKTHTITTLVLRLLLERGLPIGKILVVTYTRAATAELRDRIRRRLLLASAVVETGQSDEDPELVQLFAARKAEAAADRTALALALRDFDQAAIFTIHGFCQRVLTDHAFESASPFELRLIEDERPLLEEIAYDYWARVAYQAEPDQVLALQRARAKPVDLIRITRATAPDPTLEVLPHDAAAAGPVELGRFVAARAQAAALWNAHRAALIPELLSGALHAGSYSATQVSDDLVPLLDQLATRTPGQDVELLKRLTSAVLRQRTSKGRLFPANHAVFLAIDALYDAETEIIEHGAVHALHVRRGAVDYGRRELALRRRALGVRSFDDLLHRLDAALSGPSGQRLQRMLAERYPAALIDEFQDTDPVQYRIFRRLADAAGAGLFLIGDPKQAIYGFRGADVFAYLQASTATDATLHTLEVNWRSDPALIRGVNTLIARGPRPFLLEPIRFTPVRPHPAAGERLQPQDHALQLLIAESSGDPITKSTADAQLPALIAGEVTHLLASGATIEGRPIAPSDIAVLCRTNAQANATQQALGKLGVPTALDGDSSVFESDIASGLQYALMAVAAPTDTRKLGAALLSDVIGLSVDDVARLRSSGDGDAWLDHLSRLHQLWHGRGFMPMFHGLLEIAHTQQKLLAFSDGERKLTDLLHLGELLHEAATREHLGPLALLQWFSTMRVDPTRRREFARESAQVRLEHDEHALRLTTVHRSKGLEYPIVFCPFMWTGPFPSDAEARFHDDQDALRLKLDLGSERIEAHKELAKREELAESLRILYVALTRAKHRCYLVWGRFREAGQSALGYLLHHHEHGDDSKAISKQLKGLSDAELIASLEPLVRASEGAIGVRRLRTEPAVSYQPDPGGHRALTARSAQRDIAPWPRASSFSRLTAEAAPALGGVLDEAQDMDALVTDPIDALRAARGPRVVLADFPAGAGPGTLIHGVYENIDFRRIDPDELPAEALRQLTAFGLDAERFHAPLVQGIASSLLTPLDPADPSLMLAAIAPADRRNELEFTLCTDRSDGQPLLDRVTRALASSAVIARMPDYPARLAALPEVPQSDFMKGFIDLVFRHRGRYFVVDYKSNLLGALPQDYAQPALDRAMAEHHYVLQYHLYALALHRYLTLRAPGYDYARDFGGVYYLFMRGMAKEHAPGLGVFFDRPSLECLLALGAALGERSAA